MFLDGSLTELKITEKARISKSPQTSFKPNLEKMLKDFSKLKLTEVSDTDGVLELEVNILKLLVVVVSLLVSKERRNDHSVIMNILICSLIIII